MLKGHLIWCHRALEPQSFLIGGVIETHFPFHGIMKPFTSSLMRLIFPKFRKKLTILYVHCMPIPMNKAKFRSSLEPQAPEALSLPLYSIQWFSTPCTVESTKMIPHRLWLDPLARHCSFTKAWQVILICSQGWNLLDSFQEYCRNLTYILNICI